LCFFSFFSGRYVSLFVCLMMKRDKKSFYCFFPIFLLSLFCRTGLEFGQKTSWRLQRQKRMLARVSVLKGFTFILIHVHIHATILIHLVPFISFPLSVHRFSLRYNYANTVRLTFCFIPEIHLRLHFSLKFNLFAWIINETLGATINLLG
jgi:hypothetical protein